MPRFEVISPIKSGGKRYEVGEPIELTRAEFDALPPDVVRPAAAPGPAKDPGPPSQDEDGGKGKEGGKGGK